MSLVVGGAVVGLVLCVGVYMFLDENLRAAECAAIVTEYSTDRAWRFGLDLQLSRLCVVRLILLHGPCQYDSHAHDALA